MSSRGALRSAWVMSAVGVLALLLTAAHASEQWRAALQQTHAPEEHITAFAAFVDKFGKKYDTAEMLSRFLLFTDELTKIHTHNADYAAGKFSYFMGLNAYSDLTADEKRKMRGLNPAVVAARLRSAAAAPAPSSSSALQLAANGSSLDWRTKNAVNPIKDQGSCGSCWSFSATATMEGTYALQSGTLLSFSEQFCIDCAANGENTCQTGGFMTDCYDQVLAKGAEQLESDYPYVYIDQSFSSKGVCKFKANKAVATGAFGKYTEIARGDENALFAAVGLVPTAIAIDAEDAFSAYGGGVFDRDPQCDKSNLNHGVDLVGYGTDNGKDYYILRNSWGTTWGEKGYMRIVRGKNLCGITEMASYFKPATPTPAPSSSALPPPKPSSTAPVPPPPESSSTAPVPPPPKSSSTAPAPPPPASSSTGPAPAPVKVCGKAHEGSSLTLTCAGSAKITAINFASYGTPTGSCPSFAAGSCAKDVTAIVSSTCKGKSTCSQAVSNTAMGGDPCARTAKDLAVVATCA